MAKPELTPAERAARAVAWRGEIKQGLKAFGLAGYKWASELEQELDTLNAGADKAVSVFSFSSGPDPSVGGYRIRLESGAATARKERVGSTGPRRQ